MRATLNEENIELLGGPRPSPFESLSKILKGFCDPESSVQNGEDDEDHDDINTADKPKDHKDTEAEIADDSTSPMSEGDEIPSLVQDQDFSSVSNEEKEVEPVKVVSRCIQLPEDNSTPIEQIDARNKNILRKEEQTEVESILGTKKRSFDVVVDSGRKKRVNRIFDTAFYSLLGVIMTIFTLRMFGNVVFDFKPILHANIQSSPINFNVKKDEVVIAEDKTSISDNNEEDASLEDEIVIDEEELPIIEDLEKDTAIKKKQTDDNVEDNSIEQQSCDTNHLEGACEAKEEFDDEKDT